MQIIDLYVYEEEGGFVTVTPNKRNETDVPRRARLVANENFVLTNGTKEVSVIDVKLDEIDDWYETDSTAEATEAELKAQAYDILMGVTE